MSSRSRRPGRSSRRRHPRWRIPEGRLIGPVIAARVIDLGPAGAHVETGEALRVGAPYSFTLEVAGSRRRLSGRVRWCRLVGTRRADADRRPVYRAGIVWCPSESGGGRD